MGKVIEITEKQKKNMLHALGLDYKKKPYRNYYCCSENHEGWKDLVEKGLATKRESSLLSRGDVYFFVTEEGSKLLGVKLPKD